MFGDGSKANSLISKIIIGADAYNDYPNIHEILMRLGITSDLDAQHHFHIYLNPPDAVDIVTTQNLLADAASAADVSVTTTQTDAQGLLGYAQAIIQGEELMFIMDVPAAPAQQTPIVLVQADTSGAGTTLQPDYILKSCTETESGGDPRSAMRSVDPAGMLWIYLQNRDKHAIDLANIKNIALLEGTKHGEITAGVDNAGLTSYHYDPEPEYVGNDRAVFMVEYQGVRYKVVVELHVFSIVMENMPSSCPPPKLIKVTKPSTGSSGYDMGSVSVTFADLTGSALGQTTGPTITLDTTASGYGWFIDTTPSLNEEYLPTSNPNEWVAKAGSAAAGKMDMLSVLLHEYGHALGIDHSANPNDFMGTTLTAGVRRLPTADELALMQNLISQAKTQMTATSSTPGNAPTFPTLPLGTSFIGFL